MTARALLWASGLTASAVAHAAVAGILVATLKPEPVTEQPTPRSKLDVEAYELERTAAQQTQPEAESAPEARKGMAAPSTRPARMPAEAISMT